MVYDAKDGYVLLFGGWGTGTHRLGDTWRFVGGQWSALGPTRSPSPRANAAMAYYPPTGHVILFGGDSKYRNVGDNGTWGFSAGNWTRLTNLTTAPRERWYASMVYDAKDRYLVLFGGIDYSTYLSDTWVFSGGQWRALPHAGGPGGRVRADMAYDGKDAYVVFFGGQPYTNNDTWKFVGGNWTQLHPPHPPTNETWGAIAWDPTGRFDLMFGGTDYLGNVFSANTWEFVAGNWTQV